jgi:hypothetical protein
MKRKETAVEADRRSFLKLAGLGAVAGSATLVAGEASACEAHRAGEMEMPRAIEGETSAARTDLGGGQAARSCAGPVLPLAVWPVAWSQGRGRGADGGGSRDQEDRLHARHRVWVGQEPGFDSPFNLGAHCAKGASVREHAHGERRLKYPTKLVGGKWERISWDQAIKEDRRPDDEDPRRKRTGQRLLARLGQAQQRAGLSVPQVRRLLGHEQRRPPGAYLSLHHGRRCCKHLGLRCDDELLQRHPQ